MSWRRRGWRPAGWSGRGLRCWISCSRTSGLWTRREPWFVGDVGIEDNMIVEVGRVGRISHVLVNRTKAVESGARMGTEKGKVIGKENR